jgi:hypothetical protein
MAAALQKKHGISIDNSKRERYEWKCERAFDKGPSQMEQRRRLNMKVRLHARFGVLQIDV